MYDWQEGLEEKKSNKKQYMTRTIPLCPSVSVVAGKSLVTWMYREECWVGNVHVKKSQLCRYKNDHCWQKYHLYRYQCHRCRYPLPPRHNPSKMLLQEITCHITGHKMGNYRPWGQQVIQRHRAETWALYAGENVCCYKNRAVCCMKTSWKRVELDEELILKLGSDFRI